MTALKGRKKDALGPERGSSLTDFHQVFLRLFLQRNPQPVLLKPLLFSTEIEHIAARGAGRKFDVLFDTRLPNPLPLKER